MLKKHNVFYSSEIPDVTWYEPPYNIKWFCFSPISSTFPLIEYSLSLSLSLSLSFLHFLLSLFLPLISYNFSYFVCLFPYYYSYHFFVFFFLSFFLSFFLFLFFQFLCFILYNLFSFFLSLFSLSFQTVKTKHVMITCSLATMGNVLPNIGSVMEITIA